MKKTFSELKNGNSNLTGEQMKSIRGGAGTCGYITSVRGVPNTMRFSSSDPIFLIPPSTQIECGISKAEALSAVSHGGHWCCDSCSSTSYCGDGRNPNGGTDGGHVEAVDFILA